MQTNMQADVATPIQSEAPKDNDIRAPIRAADVLMKPEEFLMLLVDFQAGLGFGVESIGLDYGGFGVEALPTADVESILSAFPRLKMKRQLTDTRCRLVKAKPETSYDNFLRDFGERFVPGYKAVSTVDLLMNAPFDE